MFRYFLPVWGPVLGLFVSILLIFDVLPFSKVIPKRSQHEPNMITK